MERIFFFKIILVIFLQFSCFNSVSQNFVNFSPRFNQNVKGDMLLIGNNILGPSNAPFNDAGTYNHQVDMRYIDIDSDANTFSSSSADLTIDTNCFRIIYAGLYWSAVNKGSEPIEDVMIKGPTGGYMPVLNTEVFFDAGTNSVDGGKSYPYACYADVTNLVTSLGTGVGTYTVANVSSAQGRSGDVGNTTGQSAGWSLFIVYEDPTLIGKSITSFDGFSAMINGINNTLDTTVSGFSTIPAGPISSNFAFAALEGDKPIPGDQLSINGFSMFVPGPTPTDPPARPVGNFFNSTVTQSSGFPVNNRVPNSTNTLGFDTGIISVPNLSNSIIQNNDTSAVIRLETNRDTYFPYFFAFSVDIIEPNILLTKIVEDAMGNDISGQNVGLGDELNYILGFQNLGNDNATVLTIRDVLPVNLVFNYPTDLTLPPGVTVQSWNAGTRELVFEIDDSIVDIGGPLSFIRIKTTVVPSCDLLSDACSNTINNQAFATYQGVINSNVISNDPSFANATGCLLEPGTTNTLADLNCTFAQDVTLCGTSAVLTAGDGYDSYSWSTSPSGTPVIGNTQSITITSTGTYYVNNIAIAPCQSIMQTFNVTLYGSNIQNPIIPFADQVVTCPDDGKLLPNIFLCGGNDFTYIETGITNTTSMIWEILDVTSCPAVSNPDCANENTACSWSQVETGPNYVADTPGQYSLTINYEGGCFNKFYFNVYENAFIPTVTSKDIFCTTPGEITVGNVPNGYEYSIDGVNYQTSNVFSITTANTYSVFIKEIGLTSPCVYTVPDVQILDTDFAVTTNITQPSCVGDKGSVSMDILNGDPQYFYSIYSGTTLVNEVGPVAAGDFSFDNLNSGNYTINASTEGGCTFTEDITIISPQSLTASVTLDPPLTSCTEGELTVSVAGGTPPYYYYFNSPTIFQGTPTYPVTTSGLYNIRVVDSEGCEALTSINVTLDPAPDFTVSKADIPCTQAGNSGTITVTVTNANGYSLLYSIDNGVTFSNSNVFGTLAAGTYNVVVQYTKGSVTCTSTPEPITIDIVDPVIATVTLTSPYTCTSTGVITVSAVSGGTPPYEYSIDGVNFQTGLTFSGLTNGDYTVTVRDASNCATGLAPTTINALNPPTDLSFVSTPLTCLATSSTVTITPTGGTGVLQYQIVGPTTSATQTSNVFSGLAAGTYTFQVTDENNCVYSESYTIDPIPSLSVIGQLVSNVTCFGGSEGAITYTVSGSTNFTYTINGGTATSGTSPIVLTGLSGVAAGTTYTINITDTVTGCQATDSVNISGPSVALSLTTTVSQITCVAPGSVVLNATGGWGSNTYQLTEPNGNVLTGGSNNSFQNLTQTGTYTAAVTDGNNCSASTTFDLNTPTNPTANITVSNYCYNGVTQIDLTVNASGGTPAYEYSLNGGPFGTNNVYTNLQPGNYNVIVRDAFGCTFTIPQEIIAPQLQLTTALTKELDCTASPDALITGSITGGYTPYTYAVSINGGGYASLGTPALPFTYTTAAAGNYQFQVTDARGCIATSTVIAVTAADPVTASNTQRNPTCNGFNDGSITLTALTGEAPFSYSIDNGATFVASNIFGGLAAGTYNTVIRDVKNCEFSEVITLVDPAPISPTITPNPITCTLTGAVLGSIDVNVDSGGVAPYVYTIYNATTGVQIATHTETMPFVTPIHNFSNLNFGDYYVTIVDANFCQYRSPDIRILTPPLLNFSGDFDTGTCSSGLGTGYDYTVITSGGVPNYTYSILGQAPLTTTASTTYTFTQLLHNTTYFLQVEDANGCIFILEVITPPLPSGITVIGTPNNIGCNGDTGSLDFTVQNFDTLVTDINYQVLNPLTLLPVAPGISGTITGGLGGPVSGNIPNLSPGNYLLQVTEATGSQCSNTFAFQITEPIQALSSTPTVVNANCNTGAQVSLVTTGGTPPYQYAVGAPAFTPALTDFGPNNVLNLDDAIRLNWDIVVKDANDCEVRVNVTIARDLPPSISGTTISNQCTVASGFVINATATGTVLPLTYSIGNGFQATSSFTVSTPGTYNVTVKDGNGCTAVSPVTVYPPLDLTPTITTLPSCTNTDGVITVAGTGGSGFYTYSISPAITPVGNVFSGVSANVNYTITITDTTTSCTKSAQVTLEAATPVTFTTSATDVSCNNGTDGVITIDLPVSNNNPVYTYEITAPIVRAPQASPVFTGLAPGTYSVLVTSGRGCTATDTVTVGNPPLLSASGTATAFACTPNNIVSSSVLTIGTVAGGISPYLYSIDNTNYFNTNTFDIIDTGSVQNISIYVKDASNCIASNTVAVNPLPGLPVAAVAIVNPIDCNNTGSVLVTATGGSGNYTYQMLPSGAIQTTGAFNITAPGDYYFQVVDTTTGCISTATLPVPTFNNINVVASPTSSISCYGVNAGAIEINVSGYTGPYSYQVFNGVSPLPIVSGTGNTTTNPGSITGLTGGNYTVTVTETASPFCVISSNVVTIESPASPLTLVATETSNVTCDNGRGTIVAIADGGWGTYEYELTGPSTVAFSSNGTFENLSNGTYTVNVRDARGCVVSASVPTLAIPTPINASLTQTALSCFGDKNATIEVVNVTGGKGSDYLYTLNMISPVVSTTGPQTSPIFNNLGAGTYSIDVTDAYNCMFSIPSVIISEPARIQSSLVKAEKETCSVSAELTLSATGGIPPYSYSNSTDFTTPLGTFTSSITLAVTSSLAPYNFFVKDANDCIAVVSNDILVPPLTPLSVNLDGDASDSTIGCFGETTGVIAVNATGGLGNYTYTLQPVVGVQNTPGVFTELPIGSYTVRVDSEDCTDNLSFTISEPEVLVVSYTANDVVCAGEKTGSISVTSSGGTGNVTYAISPNFSQFYDVDTFENILFYAGVYQIKSQDESGCGDVQEVIIGGEDAIQIIFDTNSVVPAACEGDTNGSFIVTLSGGVPPYKVSLDNFDTIFASGVLEGTSLTVDNLSGGGKTIYVEDNVGCLLDIYIPFPDSIDFEPSITDPFYDCPSNVLINTVTVSVANIAPENLEYTLVTAAVDTGNVINEGPVTSNNVFTNIPASNPGENYYVNVSFTDPTTLVKCTKPTTSFIIEDFDDISVVLEEGEGLNEIVAVTTGGTGEYTYTLNGEDYGSVNTFLIYASGFYTVVVTDSNGCTATDRVFFEYIDVCIPNYFDPSQSNGWGPGCTTQYKELTVDIFDRYGRKVVTLGVNEVWDGKYNGLELPSGDYWYLLRLNDPRDDREFVGHFTLYR